VTSGNLGNMLLPDGNIFCFKRLCHSLWHFSRQVVHAVQFCNRLLQNWRGPIFTGKANHVPDISLGEPFDLRQVVILGEGEVALEVKGKNYIDNKDLKPMKAFMETFSPDKAFVICNEQTERLAGKITIIPWRQFLTRLWEGKIIS